MPLNIECRRLPCAFARWPIHEAPDPIEYAAVAFQKLYPLCTPGLRLH